MAGVNGRPQNEKFVSVVCAEDFTGKKNYFVKDDGTLGDATSANLLGVCVVEGESGETITVQVGGYAQVKCTGACPALGLFMRSDVAGTGVDATTADDEGFKIVKVAGTSAGLATINLDHRMRIHA